MKLYAYFPVLYTGMEKIKSNTRTVTVACIMMFYCSLYHNEITVKK